MLLLQGCGSATSNENNAVPPIALPASNLPFATKEPAEYQATVVMRSGEVESRTFVARKGANRRTDHRLGSEDQMNVIESDKLYRILPGKSVFTEQDFGSGLPPDRPFAGFTDQLLNVRSGALFTETGKKDGLAVFRVTFEDSPSSEAAVYFSSELGMPVRQEFYSLAGGSRTLMSIIELRDLSMTVNDAIFGVPTEYRRVYAAEFEKLLAQ